PLVERLLEAIDPTPTQRHIERLGIRDGRQPRALLVDLQPQLTLPRMVPGDPSLEGSRIPEATNLLRIGDDGGHGAETERLTLACGEPRASAGTSTSMLLVRFRGLRALRFEPLLPDGPAVFKFAPSLKVRPG